MSTLLSNADLETSYAEAEEKFKHRNPKSAAMHASAAEVMPGGNTRTVLHYAPYPLTFSKGEGAHLYDADGHKLVDFLGEYTACLLYTSPSPRDLSTSRMPSSA